MQDWSGLEKQPLWAEKREVYPLGLSPSSLLQWAEGTGGQKMCKLGGCGPRAGLQRSLGKFGHLFFLKREEQETFYIITLSSAHKIHDIIGNSCWYPTHVNFHQTHCCQAKRVPYLCYSASIGVNISENWSHCVHVCLWLVLWQSVQDVDFLLGSD